MIWSMIKMIMKKNDTKSFGMWTQSNLSTIQPPYNRVLNKAPSTSTVQYSSNEMHYTDPLKDTQKYYRYTIKSTPTTHSATYRDLYTIYTQIKHQKQKQAIHVNRHTS